MEPLLRPLLGILNRRIREVTPALDLARELAGHRVAIRVRDTAIAVDLTIDPDGLSPTGDGADDEPDLIIEGSPLALLSLGGSDPLAAVRDGRVTLTGDAEVADGMRKLLQLARPDIEDEVAGLVGEQAAQRLGTVARGIVGWGRERAEAIGASLGARLADGEALPGSDEFAEFGAAVKALRDRTARLEARLKQYERRDSGPTSPGS